MNEMLLVDNANSLEIFIQKVDGFHDSLLHELVVQHPGYVDRSRRMFGDAELFNARLIFQLQSQETPAVCIHLAGISRLQLNPKREFMLEGEFVKGEIFLYFCGKDASAHSEIRAKEMKYVLLGEEFLGPDFKLVRRD